MDYPRDDIAKMAHAAIMEHGGPTVARVFFKFTCPACGTRCTFNDPNTLYERGECADCGHDAPVTHAGYALHVGVPRPGARTLVIMKGTHGP
jgi:predicted RNA-binding Zn-ribbon protein involved in translation (DUF1610 family)